MFNRSPRLLALAPVVLGLCMAGSCAPAAATSADPLVTMRDKTAHLSARTEAIDQAWRDAESGKADRTATREAIKTIVWQGGQPAPLRIRAIQRLLDDSTPEGLADTRKALRLRLPTENDWDVLGTICDAAATRGWVEFGPALVRSYARVVKTPSDDQRPERAALLKLHPGIDITDVVFAVFAAPATGTAPAIAGTPAIDLDDRARRDAWVLLSRLDPSGSRRATLLAADSTPTTDPIVADLRAGASDLHAVPVTAAELDWLRALRDGKDARNAAWWSEATSAIARLTPAQLDRFQLRHVEPVRWAAAHRSEWLGADRASLLSELESRQRSRTLFPRTAEVGGNMGRPDGRLQPGAPDLVWADLLAILVIDEAIRDRAVVASVFGQVEIDRRDTSTEYGGILEATDASSPPAGTSPFVATLFPPRPVQRMADNRFIASDEMIQSSGRSLAHYHFHVQRERNSEYAGPGDGDLEYASTQGRSCLVLTSIDLNTLNVDYYQRNGSIVDLGTISR